MKKTLTVNLGGTVFHIDEDAYRLLDNYLNNLKLYFCKDAGADEIVGDIERRISELFIEKLVGGLQVITIADVEEVIARIGKPEEMEPGVENDAADGAASDKCGSIRRRFFRNPDDKMLGGVLGGLAAYLGCDATLLRLAVLFLSIFGFKWLLLLYVICWIVVPEARTAAEKLSMRGEAVTVENIGKTVTGGFDKVKTHIEEGGCSEKSHNLLQRTGDGLITLVVWCLKLALVLFVIFCSPVLFASAILFVILLVAGIIVGVGGTAVLFTLFPMADVVLPTSPLATIVVYLAGILMAGIPLASLVFIIVRPLFKWQPMASGLKWTLLALWLVSTAVFSIGFFSIGGIDVF